VFTLFTLPAFLSILQVVDGVKAGEANYEASIYNRGLLALGRLGVNRPYLVLILFLTVTLAAGLCISELHFFHNELHCFAEDPDFMRQTRLIEAQTGGFRALEVLIDTQRERGIIDHTLLQDIQKMAAYLKSEMDIHGRAYIGRTRSPVDLIQEIPCTAKA
jgi:predicted RND superfamily exporter protein